MLMNLNELAQMILKNNTRFGNPVLDNAVQMYRANNSAGLEQMARNLAKEKGVDIEELRKRLNV